MPIFATVMPVLRLISVSRCLVTTRTLLVCHLVGDFCMGTMALHLCHQALNMKALQVRLSFHGVFLFCTACLLIVHLFLTVYCFFQCFIKILVLSNFCFWTVCRPTW